MSNELAGAPPPEGDARFGGELVGESDRAGRRTGTWRNKEPGDVTIEVPFVEGRVHGVVRQLLANGHVLSTESWADDRLHGPSEVFPPDGDIARMTSNYVDGEIDGVAQHFARDGTLVEEAHFAAGLRHGASRAFDLSGALVEETRFAEGLPHGSWSHYSQSGELAAQRTWFHGVPHGRESFASIGLNAEWVHGVRVDGGFTWLDSNGAPATAPVVRLLVVLIVFAFAVFAKTGLVATLVALTAAIVIHEFGHLFAGRMVGIPIARFRVGFGPRIASWVWRSTPIDVRAIPLFGFVQPALVRPSAYPHIERALGRGPKPTNAVSSAEDVVAVTDLAPARANIVFSLGGVAFNLVSAWLARWLVFDPSSPLQAATWCLERAGRLIAIVPNMLLDLVTVSTYTEDRAGLLRFGEENVHGLYDAVDMFVFVSLFLAAFNIFPIPPLDGFRVVSSLAERAVGKERADRVLRPLRIVGIVVFGVLILAGLWFMGRDLFGVLFG